MTKDNTRPVETPEPREDARSADDRGAGGSTGPRGPRRSGTGPDPEVVPRATRRRFSAAYKLRIVQQADGCAQPGEIGALLRREGLYSSHLLTWRRARDQGQLDALAPKRRGPKPDPALATSRREQRLEREVVRLERRLETAEIIIDVQRKVSRLLGIEIPETSRSDT